MKTIACFLMVFIGCVASAQQSPDFKSMRFDEDYSTVNDSTFGSKWYSRMKHLNLSENRRSYLSFGGDVRYQYFYVENENWGDSPEDHDGYILSRFLFHADLHLGKRVRFFVQTQSSLAEGRLDPSPVDQNPLELHQGFADFGLLENPTQKTALLLRIGRQELSYGSQRLVAVREGPNNRQSFDGAKAMLKVANFKADFFYTHYVRASDDIFDDESNDSRQFWGSYFRYDKIPYIGTTELYYLGLYRESVAFDSGITGNETRHSVGMRLANQIGGWRYDLEGVYQFGRFAMTDISAWTASVNTAFRFNSLKFKPEIGLKTEIISGDRDVTDDKTQTFNPLFPRGAYFGLAALVGPSNLIDVHPSISFNIAEGLDWTIDYDAFWRFSEQDGLYAPNASLIYPAGDSGEKEIGQQLATDFTWDANAFLSFRAEFTWFKAGKYLQSVTPGNDIIFTGLTMQLQF
ncbi:alginate export family protein [Flavobacterium sp. MAH-1]|uniref:Alginate export family protein n=1 Tax=Flavobacterium agri TaxID=2743471 RepID=A0A7Y8Y2U7_9FLAO|nr:alginate export family protein [Flavobacterium agri]NUY81492.1 alginate export family protein [Flavobacterium agri]NYA71516.1 alginate export family protein [Flavobacterium agri]